jgi:hypothetical protein
MKALQEEDVITAQRKREEAQHMMAEVAEANDAALAIKRAQERALIEEDAKISAFIKVCSD